MLYQKLNEVKCFYEDKPIVPEEEEIRQAFALSLVDIARYCLDNKINAKNIDTVKLLMFSVPHLLSIRKFAVRLDMYFHACMLIIHGEDSSTVTIETIRNTAKVTIHLFHKFPSQHLVVYGYLKGYQESLEANSRL
ncbi:MAG: hypothetical protein A6F71_09480 [Cycloclasticus sp. symbiont of Poecilosclerida sp. M]|nr:MAG: hypothetical protein A6F71_09480 [Cycloclasticus sp. symbiont of Poecilosclerida sp. M]